MNPARIESTGTQPLDNGRFVLLSIRVDMQYEEVLTSILFLLSGLGLYGLRHRRDGRAWKTAVAGISGLLILSWPPAIGLAALPLTGRYLKEGRPSGNADVIVVLSGSVNPPTRRRPYVLLGQDTYKRVMHAAWLFSPLGSTSCSGQRWANGFPS